jgi:hypothetical protein
MPVDMQLQALLLEAAEHIEHLEAKIDSMLNEGE